MQAKMLFTLAWIAMSRKIIFSDYVYHMEDFCNEQVDNRHAWKFHRFSDTGIYEEVIMSFFSSIKEENGST